MKRIILIIPILMLLFPINSFAFTLLNVTDTGNYLDLPPFYYAPKDEIRIKYNTREITTVVWDFVETGTGRTHHKELNAPSGYWYVASGFTCIGTYTTTMKNRGGDALATVTIKIEEGDLHNPICESDGAGETGSDDAPGGEANSCATAICECINDLKSVNQGINDSVNSNGQTLGEIKQNTGLANMQLEQVNNSIVDNGVKIENLTSVTTNILGELKTDNTVSSGNDIIESIPSVNERIERNKPDEHPFFEDDTIYFKDEGDAEPVGKMPPVPDVKDWDGVTRENEGTPEVELKKDVEGQKENELKKDVEIKKENELKLDEFKKDNELPLDQFQKDDELKKEDMQIKDSFDKSPELNKTHEYEQTNKY